MSTPEGRDRESDEALSAAPRRHSLWRSAVRPPLSVPRAATVSSSGAPGTKLGSDDRAGARDHRFTTTTAVSCHASPLVRQLLALGMAPGSEFLSPSSTERNHVQSEFWFTTLQIELSNKLKEWMDSAELRARRQTGHVRTHRSSPRRT